MPWDPKRYPPEWAGFSRDVREVRAQGRCECTGQCGLHRTGGTPRPCGRPGCSCEGVVAIHLHEAGRRRCAEYNGEPGVWAKGRIVLTVAHLCDCEPPCAIDTHVIAACQRCHLRIDVPLHQRNASATRARKAAGHSLPLPMAT